MIGVLARNWGWVALRGLIAILFGVFTLMRPGITLVTLVVLFGAFALADGVFMVVSAVMNRHGEARWGTLLLGGMLGIAIGVVTFLWPGITAVALLALIAVWAIFTGLAEISAAIQLRRVITGEWLLILAGLLGVAFGILLIARPAVGAIAVVFWIGSYAILAGILQLALSLRLRNWGHMHPAH